MKEYTYNEIVEKAKNIKTNVKKEYEIGEPAGWSYYIAKEVMQRTKTVERIGVAGASNSNGNDFGRQLNKAQYLDMAERFTKFVEKNKKLPNYITYNKYKVRVSDYTYMFARILAYYDNKKKLPAYVNVNSKAFIKPSESTNDVYDYFVKVFGKISCIDDALEKIAGRGYGYYYDDKYSNRQSIDRMKNRQGINCTDSAAVFYNIAQALGYTVRAVHVKCQGGDGHIRLQVKHKTRTNNQWINRDPAAVLDNGGITSVWCLNGTILSYDPQWFLENLNR